MFVPSTGIASSISCSVDCTEVTASTVRGESVSDATVRWNRESACRCSAGLRAAATSACACSSWASRTSSSCARRRQRRGAGLDDPAEVQRVQPVLSARRA